MRTKALIGAASALLIGFALTAGTAQAQYFEGTDSGFPVPTGDSSFVPAGSKLMRLFDGGCILTEGVAAGHDGYMYFSDITFSKFCPDPSEKFVQAGNIWRYDPKSGDTTTSEWPEQTSSWSAPEFRPPLRCYERSRIVVLGGSPSLSSPFGSSRLH